MICDTLIRTDPDGRKHYKPKMAYDTLDSAILSAKKMNIYDKQLTKLVGYKCTHCQKYHIGRSGRDLTEKEKEKYRKELGVSLKIVGYIDLKK